MLVFTKGDLKHLLVKFKKEKDMHDISGRQEIWTVAGAQTPKSVFDYSNQLLACVLAGKTILTQNGYWC